MQQKESFNLESIKLKESRVFRDPIHSYIHVDHLVFWQLINTKEMQRLRRIRQLGGTYQVYQTAEHSRFTHSLGVYEIARQMIELDELSNVLNDYDKMTVLCAALLHDIGHGPFSHAFEHVFNTKHELITEAIILGDSEVNYVLSQYGVNLAQDVAKVIAKTHPNRLLIQIISSQIDADRMDYLLRDSYFTGTTYGHYDLQRILRTLRVYDGKIVYKESGVQAIENYILARYHMYWQVYYHPTARSYEQLLVTVFRRIQDLYQSGYEFRTDIRYLLPFLQQSYTYNDYLKLDEAVILYYFEILREEEDSILVNLTTRFIQRGLFKHMDLTNDIKLDEFKKKIAARGFDPKYYVLTDDQEQIPYKHYGATSSVEDIQIITKDNKVVSLPDVSEVVNAIVNSKKIKTDKKIYFPK